MATHSHAGPGRARAAACELAVDGIAALVTDLDPTVRKVDDGHTSPSEALVLRARLDQVDHLVVLQAQVLAERAGLLRGERPIRPRRSGEARCRPVLKISSVNARSYSGLTSLLDRGRGALSWQRGCTPGVSASGIGTPETHDTAHREHGPEAGSVAGPSPRLSSPHGALQYRSENRARGEGSFRFLHRAA